MRTDTIFYQLFQTFPDLLFELMGQSPSESQGYEFSSREVKELAFRFDGIFLPPSNVMNRPIYFVEVQFQAKSDFYWRFFTEIFLYLGQYKPQQDWLAVAIFANRRLDSQVPMQYRGILLSQQVKFVYLEEIETTTPSIGLEIVQLVVSTEVAIEQTNRLVQHARQQLNDATLRQKVLELIETILVYKFTQFSRQEIETMFSLSDLKQTRVYQEAKEEGKLEGKLEAVPLLLQLGLSIEAIAQQLNLDPKAVRQAAQINNNT